MRRRAAVALLLLVGCGGGSEFGPPDGPWPTGDVAFRITTPGEDVDFGKGFPLVVERVWTDGFEPEGWDDRLLEPLVLRPLSKTTEARDGRTREVRAFTASVFERETAALPPCRFVARSPTGTERVARSAPLSWTVRPARGPEDGPEDGTGVEPPPGPLGGRGGAGPWLWAFGGVALVLLTAGALRRRRPFEPERAPEPEVVADDEPEVPAIDVALSALAELRSRPLDGPDDREALLEDVVTVTRTYLETGPRVGAPEWTSEELLAAGGGLPRDARDALRALLVLVDGVKFAARPPSERGCGQALDHAEACVRTSEVVA